MMIKGVFFDLYGTLLIYDDRYDAWSDFLSEFYICLQNYGLSIPKETFDRCCERFFDRDEPPRREDGLTIFERRIQALCSELEINIRVSEIKHTATTIANAIQQRHYLDPDCYPVLEALRQRKILALISNFDHPPHIRALVRNLGLEEFFTTIVISGDVGIKKPDPRIFQLALQRTRLQPEAVVYVGDTEEDITGSLAAGIAPILIQRDRFQTVLHPVDFRAELSSRQTQPGAKNVAGVKTIASLPELIEVLE